MLIWGNPLYSLASINLYPDFIHIHINCTHTHLDNIGSLRLQIFDKKVVLDTKITDIHTAMEKRKPESFFLPTHTYILPFKGNVGRGRHFTFSLQAEMIVRIYTEEISLLNLWRMSSYIYLIFESNVLWICIHIHCWRISTCLRLFGDQIRMLVPIVSSVLRTSSTREHVSSANCMSPAICLSHYTC